MKKIKKFFNQKISPKTIPFLIVGILIAAFVLKIYTVYFGYIYYHYIVPPGYDALPHWLNIKAMLEQGRLNFSGFPPGFYFLVIALSKIFSRDVFHILTYWTPILIILPSAALFFLLRQLFDLKVSSLVTIIFLITSGFPLYAFVDGNYPDMLAYGFFAILLFAFLIRYLKKKKKIDLIASAVLLVLIALTHHLSFFIVSLVLLVFGLVIVLYDRSILKSIFSPKRRIYLYVALIIIFFCLAAAFYFYGNLLVRFGQSFLTLKPAISNLFWNTPTDYIEYPYLEGALIWYFGAAGFFWLIVSSFINQKDRQIKILFICWILVLFLLSRITLSSLPGRFARELAVPLAVLVAYLFDYLINQNKLLKSKIALAFGGGLIGYLIFMNSSIFSGINTLPKSFNDWVWFWSKDQEKLDYLKSHIEKDEPILFNPNANIWVPVKSKNKLISLELGSDQEKIVRDYLNDKNDPNRQKYDRLIEDIHNQYQDEKFLFIDVLPPSNPNPAVYWPFAGFDAKDAVLKTLAEKGKILEKFNDGAQLVEIK